MACTTLLCFGSAKALCTMSLGWRWARGECRTRRSVLCPGRESGRNWPRWIACELLIWRSDLGWPCWELSWCCHGHSGTVTHAFFTTYLVKRSLSDKQWSYLISLSSNDIGIIFFELACDFILIKNEAWLWLCLFSVIESSEEVASSKTRIGDPLRTALAMEGLVTHLLF